MAKKPVQTLATLPLSEAKARAREAGFNVLSSGAALARMADRLWDYWSDEHMSIAAPDQSDDEFGEFLEAMRGEFLEGVSDRCEAIQTSLDATKYLIDESILSEIGAKFARARTLFDVIEDEASGMGRTYSLADIGRCLMIDAEREVCGLLESAEEVVHG